MSEDEDLEACWNALKPVARGRGKRLNLLGRRFGRLLVEAPTGRRNSSGSALWDCLCDCQNRKEVSTNDLMQGRVKSCGCWLKERLSGGVTR